MNAENVTTGNASLDGILGGGFTPNRIYLLEGHPGTGKTTIGLQFLLEGAARGEKGLYVSLSETAGELRAIASSHGWSLDGIEIHELVDPSESLNGESHYTMFQPSEVELAETTRGMVERVEAINPKRVVIDSLSELRLLSQSALRFRRQILALKQFFVGRECTAILLDDKTTPENDLQLQSIAHGVISLERQPTDFGDERRRLRVIKFRGRKFVGGWNDFDIERGGITIYPRVATNCDSQEVAKLELMLSGNSSIDRLLGQGIEPGTSTLLLGPAGVGKSSFATLFAATACGRDERALVFLFDEHKRTFMSRSAGLGMDLASLEAQGLMDIRQVNPGDVTPGHFAEMVRQGIKPDAEGRKASIVIIDSLNGYLSSMPEERFLQIQMHELLTYLASCGVATFLVVAQHGMLGSKMETPVDASYLADTVVLFRYFEAAGEIHQAISVVKKRDGRHERTIREYRMVDGQIVVGEPLAGFHGILAGTPVFAGKLDTLMGAKDRDA